MERRGVNACLQAKGGHDPSVCGSRPCVPPTYPFERKTVSGIYRRLAWIIPKDRPALWLPVDDSLISGPETGLRDVRKLFTEDLLHYVDAVLGFGGTAYIAAKELVNTPLVINLTASTVLQNHTHKVQVSTVRRALGYGADAVAVHLNVGSPSEQEQMSLLGDVVDEAEDLGIPVVAIAYFRSVGRDGSDLTIQRAESVRHAVRVAVEIGADAVKTTFTGSEESFATVVEAAMGVPVLIAGGAMEPEDVSLFRARQAIQAGAVGVAYGRQIFQRPDPVSYVVKLKAEINDAYVIRQNRLGNTEELVAVDRDDREATTGGRYGN